MLMNRFSKLKWWQIALLSLVVSALGGLASAQPSRNDKQLYDKKLKQAPWAPPGWLFAPAWNINNFFLLLALQKLSTANIPQKKRLLVLQGMIWLIFFSFGHIYFNKKSPVLAATWTVADAVLAITSFVLIYKSDKKLSYKYLPIVIWTSFASTLAVYQALYNHDPIVKTKALLN